MMNRKFIIFCLIVLLSPLLNLLPLHEANALGPAVTITPVEAATNTNMDICFGWTSQDDLDGTKNLALGFFQHLTDPNQRFDITGLTPSEVTVYIDSADCGSTQGGNYEARVTEGFPGSDNNDHDLIISIDIGEYKTLLINLDTDVSVTNGGDMSIGIANVAGDSLKTPVTAGNYKTIIEQYLEGASPTDIDWLETQLLYIGELNKVDITASLDPTISLALDTNTCNLNDSTIGSLTMDKIQSCGFKATVTTNIGSGYTGYIEQNHPFQTDVNGVIHAIGAPTDDLIEASGEMEGTFGEYGFGILTADTTSWPEFTGLCSDYDEQATTDLPAQEITGNNSRNIYATYTSPVNGTDHGVTDFCAGVRIKYDTPPGAYDHTITITVVGNF